MAGVWGPAGAGLEQGLGLRLGGSRGLGIGLERWLGLGAWAGSRG